MSDENALAAVDSAITARVVESLVIRGDISALNPEERSRFYLATCEAMGLNPRTQPFAILRLNGKEILYPTRGATDQLAAMHRLDRRIIEGPKVIDLNGTKMAFAVCEARHPNGRVETAVATVPLNDPLMALMKVETKAKRRVTLSILGFGMLDETEVDDIPPAEREPITEHPELLRLHEQLQTDGGPPAVEQLIGVYGDLRRATNDQRVIDAAFDECVAFVKARRWDKVVAFKKGAREIEAEVAAERFAAKQPPAPAAATRPAEAPPAASQPMPPPDPLAEYHSALADVTIPSQCVAIAVRFRHDLAALTKEARDHAWIALVNAATRAGQANAAEWLRAALRPKGPPDEPPPAGARAANDPPVDPEGERGDAYEGPDPVADAHQARLLAAIGRMKECNSSVHVARHFATHVDELPEAVREGYRDAARVYLHARYSRAVPSLLEADRLLDAAMIGRDGDGKATRVA